MQAIRLQRFIANITHPRTIFNRATFLTITIKKKGASGFNFDQFVHFLIPPSPLIIF